MNKNKRYLIACSGGPDSMALLDMSVKKGYYLQVAHVNYHKRETANRDEKIVRDYCNKNNIVFYVLNVFPDEIKGNFQAYARKVRYEFFAQICQNNQLEAVLVAHHLDDLLETYLMQEKKKVGVGYYGLSKKNYIYNVKVLRPLLNKSKKQLVDYCKKNQIVYGIDESNLSDDYQRNRIRHQEVEKLSLKQKKELLEIIKNKNLEKQEEEKIALKYLNQKEYNIAEFVNISNKYNLLRYIFPNKSNKYLKEVLRQINSAKKCLYKGKQYYLCKEYDLVHIFKIPKDYLYRFDSYQDLKKKKYSYFELTSKGEKIQGVTISKNDFPIYIRPYKDSDAIKMRYGTKKINRFFIDNKIYSRQRMIWPVMVNKNEEVIFVPKIGCDVNHYSEKPTCFMLELLYCGG